MPWLPTNVVFYRGKRAHPCGNCQASAWPTCRLSPITVGPAASGHLSVSRFSARIEATRSARRIVSNKTQPRGGQCEIAHNFGGKSQRTSGEGKQAPNQAFWGNWGAAAWMRIGTQLCASSRTQSSGEPLEDLTPKSWRDVLQLW